MRILHTADWHIGKKLYGRQRFAEHSGFLNWLLEALVNEKVDGLIVAGDIFDTANPSEQSRKIYQEFLAQACKKCDWIVITGGNHDSPSVLNGSRELLHHLNIHVVGKKCENLEDELVEIKNANGETSAYIAAVPYLRDRDLRQSTAGESEQQKEKNLRHGIKAHYDALANLIQKKRGETKIPTIAVGHLYAAGCNPETEGDGVRDLYVGGLGHVSAETFSTVYDYVALGHIHVPQIVGKKEHIRYCGAPIPMGYGEAGQSKQVILLDFKEDQSAMKLEILKIPTFQSLKRIKGDLESINHQISQLITEQSDAWLEIIYTGEAFQGDLKSEISAMIEGSALEVLKVENRTIRQRTMQAANADETLDQLSVTEVFERCLTDHDVAQEERQELRQAYNQITNLVESEAIR
ncbi:MAG: exonuclease SbcCD subunit D C-terminal domain-containing protein [Akkermansiaceae bacterium]